MDITSEHFESVGLTIHQPAKGHRYGEESLLLADFVNTCSGERVVEFGSGVGVISILVAARGKPDQITAVEIQESLHAIACNNVRENGLGDLVKCLNTDYRKFADGNPNSCDLVISNPPFYAIGSGRMPADFQRARARHEIDGDLNDLFKAAKRALKSNGRLAMVYIKDRHDELMNVALSLGFEEIRHERDANGSVFLVEFSTI